jgi:pyruvate ferredoxin oxidoreductase gamma subunit
MGAPVTAFCRISNREIRLREPILGPTAVIIQDRTVIEHSDAFQGLVEGGFVRINSPIEVQNNLKNVTVKCIDATGIALEHIGRPIPNSVLLGSFAALTKNIGIDSVIEAIKIKFTGSVAEKNIMAARVAYDKTMGEI